MSRTKRKVISRLVNGPEFSFDDIYVTIFNERRKFDEDGNQSYIPIEKNFKPSGVRIFNRFIKYMADGNISLRAFCSKEGLLFSELSTLGFIMVGMTALEFKSNWIAKRAGELLRYTDLSSTQVARISGAGSRANLYHICKNFYDISALLYRNFEREELDLNRYRL